MMREIIIPFATGLTIFMFGLQVMRIGLEQMAGERLRLALLRFTKTPLRSFSTGIATTAFLQSSSAVTVLTIGFVNAGMLTFTHSIGIILGTNIGTTVTTQVMALNIEDFALPLIIIGVLLWLLPLQKVISNLGLASIGFGCIFLGMDAMRWVATPLQEHGMLAWLLNHQISPVWMGLFVGCVITALIHSSSACIAITMGFYATGVIELPFAIAVVFGSNVGTCVTAILAAIHTGIAAKRVALAHFILNVAGVAIFIPFIYPISEYAPLLSSDPATQIAHIQTLFNIICSIVVLPFIHPFAQGVSLLVPEKAGR
ncbi:Na/Pi cotransporter family protein [Polycladospora coralii]|nr:Na/Pi symporter [Polycladospora coralii]